MSKHLERIAIHEAAHAVAMEKLFPRNYPEKLTIVPNDDEYFGVFRPAEYVGEISINTPQNEADEHFIKYATVCCAGYAATIVFGFPDEEALEGCESDFETAGAYLEQGKVEALNFCTGEENKKAIRFVADMLLECKTFEVYDELAVLLEIAFEVFSAFSTVGLSLGITPELSEPGKYVVIFLMFFGRIGLINLMIGILKNVNTTEYTYPKQNILIN